MQLSQAAVHTDLPGLLRMRSFFPKFTEDYFKCFFQRMFSFFKKKNRHLEPKAVVSKATPMNDLNGVPLQEGDIVDCLRYDLGRCKVILSGNSYVYESLASGRQVSWAKMVDAATSFQKVIKIIESNPS